MLATAIAQAGHPDGLAPVRVTALANVPLAARGHELPLWQADFGDPAGSRYLVSGATGELLERLRWRRASRKPPDVSRPPDGLSAGWWS